MSAMVNWQKVAPISVSVFLIFGCAKKASQVGLSVSMPTLTGPVAGSAASSIHAGSAGLLLSAGTACSACTSNPAKNAYMLSLNFVSLGQGSDSTGCMVKALINGGDLAADGTAKVIQDPDSGFKLKVAATVTNKVVSSYTMHGCNGTGASANSSYISGQVGLDGTTTIISKFDETRNPSPGTTKVNFSVSGVFLNDAWQSKTIGMLFTDPNSVQQSTITQSSNYLIVQGSFHETAIDVQSYSKYTLLGNSGPTYAMDAGSSKESVNSGADSTGSWDSNGATGGSVFLSDVTSATYLPVPMTFTGAIAGSETWDCSVGATPVIDMSTVSPGTIANLMACSQ